jgi:hypothetical protein
LKKRGSLRNLSRIFHRQAAWEMPENPLSQQILSINIGSATKVEWVIDGRFQQEKEILACRIWLAWDKQIRTILQTQDLRKYHNIRSTGTYISI